MVLGTNSLEMCIHSLPRSLLGPGRQGVDPETGSCCCSEGLRTSREVMAGLQKGNGLVGCLHVGQEPFEADVLSQCWLQKGFGPGLLSSSSALGCSFLCVSDRCNWS